MEILRTQKPAYFGNFILRKNIRKAVSKKGRFLTLIAP